MPYCKSAMTLRSTDHLYLQRAPPPVAAMIKSSAAEYVGYLHSHERAQFLYAASGTMKLTCDLGCWIIPPHRAVWLPAEYLHQTGTIHKVEMRTLHIRADAIPANAPVVPRMLSVSSLLHELTLRLTEMPIKYDESGQDGQIVAALPLLAEGTPLVEIADRRGYGTAWAFTAMFKRVTGKLPSRYFSHS